MDDQELEALLADLESDRVERKESLSEKDKVYQAICAFANDLPDHRNPGVIFLGAKDDGCCAGLAITDALLRELADMRDQGLILPLPAMTVQKRTLRGCEMAVVTVLPADSPPVQYRGRIWVRVGPRRAVASREEERRLNEKRRWRDIPFDAQPVRSAAVSDLDLDLFGRVYLPTAVSPEVLERNDRTTEEQLLSTRFLAPEDVPIPTVAGILTVGKDPGQFLPGAYIQFVRFDGLEVTDPIKDQREIRGPLPELLRILDETLQVNVAVAATVTGQPVETRHPDYPIGALQQFARNAVMHRVYEGTNAPVRIHWFRDRVEMLSPGGPFGHVTQENFGRPGVTDYRNPHLAEVMKNLGYVQRFGMGIPLARRELSLNGNPPPEFQIEAAFVAATVRIRP